MPPKVCTSFACLAYIRLTQWFERAVRTLIALKMTDTASLWVPATPVERHAIRSRIYNITERTSFLAKANRAENTLKVIARTIPGRRHLKLRAGLHSIRGNRQTKLINLLKTGDGIQQTDGVGVITPRTLAGGMEEDLSNGGRVPLIGEVVAG
jgi:hypothetical protein